MKNDAIDFDDSNFKKLFELLESAGKVHVNVGIMGSLRPERTGKATNAEIGRAHEFGTEHLPERSFLRMPLWTYMRKKMEKADLFSEDFQKNLIKDKSFVPVAKKLGVMAEELVLEAFDTGGFGNWKPSNMDNKKNHQTLVETQQLRDSITNVVGVSNDSER